MIAWWWLLVVAVVGIALGYAWGADANTPAFRPLDVGQKILVPMDDGDAIALEEGIMWTFGQPREQARLKALARRYADARYNSTVEASQ